MTRIFAAIFGTLLSVTPLFSQAGSDGVQIVARTELRAKRDAEPAGARPRWLPDGKAEMEYVTDGRSVRAVLHGRMAGQLDGTVSLSIAGDPDHYVLNPVDRTYWVAKPRPAGTSPEGSATAVQRTNTFETIAGYRAEKMTLVYRELPPPPPGVAPMELRVELETWCTSQLDVPAGMVMNMALSFMNEATAREFQKACPLVLRSVMRMSTMPGYEVTSVVTSIQKVSPSPDLFRVPPGYREVQRPLRAPECAVPIDSLQVHRKR
jgi:hypothetical protein